MAQVTDRGDAEDALRRAIAAHQQGRLDEASAAYAEALELDAENVQALRLSGVLARQRGDVAASIRALEAAIRLAPEDATTANDLALSFISDGNLPAAEIALRSALDNAPGSTRALANLGALLQQRGHVLEATDVYRQCLEFAPDDIEVRCNLANAWMEAGREDEALAECDRALATVPGHPLILAAKGAVRCAFGRYHEAAEVLTDALARNPRDDMALVNLAYARRELGDDQGAIDALRRAANVNPDNARAAADLANLLLVGGETPAALDVCDGFLRAHPGERLVLATRAYALVEAGDVAEADRLLDYERLVRVCDIGTPDGYRDVDSFNAELAAFVAGHPSLLADPVRKATTGGAQTGELNPIESAACGALDAAIRRAVQQTIDALHADGFGHHEVMAYAAERWALRTWGTVLHAGGQQTPHQHPLAWLSGVYYVQLPGADDDAGELEFGQPPERIRITSAPPTRRVKPLAGRVVMFPSWFYHRTRPFSASGTRISIAFDVMPCR